MPTCQKIRKLDFRLTTKINMINNIRNVTLKGSTNTSIATERDPIRHPRLQTNTWSSDFNP